MEQLRKNANIIDGVNQTKDQIKEQLSETIVNGKKYLTILELPAKGSPSDFDIKEFDEIYLSDIWADKAEKDDIPYSKEYFVVYKINKNTQDKPESINIMGSCGGGYTKIPWNTPNLIKRKK
tara:strand:+ start:92 stop:457 length:366 start_codon:yes stop_codon:yes gene_type:complete